MTTDPAAVALAVPLAVGIGTVLFVGWYRRRRR